MPVEKIINQKNKLEKELRQTVSKYILAGLGVVAALAWNDAIKALIEFWYPQQGNTVTAKVLYAVILTLIIVIASMLVGRLFKIQAEE